MSKDSESLAKDLMHLSLAELEAGVGEWMPGSLQRAAYAQAIQLKKEELAATKEKKSHEECQKEFEQTERHHSEKQKLTRISVWISAGSLAVALASFFAGRFWPTSQVSRLEERVTRIEHQLVVTTSAHQQLPLAQEQQTNPRKSGSLQAKSTPNPSAQTMPEQSQTPLPTPPSIPTTPLPPTSTPEPTAGLAVGRS